MNTEEAIETLEPVVHSFAANTIKQREAFDYIVKEVARMKVENERLQDNDYLATLVRSMPAVLGLHAGIYWSQNEQHEKSWFYYIFQDGEFKTKGG